MAKKDNKMIRRRLVNSWISTMITISLVLFLVGAAALLLLHARSISDYFKENMQVSVILKQDVSDGEALSCQKKLEKLPFVKETAFISREQGMAEMAEMLGEDFLSVFETAPVPVSIDLMLKAEYVSPDSLELVKARVGAFPAVEEVVCQASAVDALNSNLRKISLVIGVLVILLLFISVVLIGNTVRLHVFSKRFTIHTMRQVGATRSFIRRPFVLRSALLGLSAAVLAIGLLSAGLYFLRKDFVQLFQVIRPDLLLIVFGIVIVSGLVICTVSTFLVVNRLIGYSRDDLYAF